MTIKQNLSTQSRSPVSDSKWSVFEIQVSSLYWFDILGSASRGVAPHFSIDELSVHWQIHTSRIMGCHCWIMTAIGELASLGLRQEPKTRAQRLKIESTLENGLIALESDSRVRFPLSP